jgi:hypothetical protein
VSSCRGHGLWTVADQLWDSRFVLRGVSMHRGAFSRYFKVDLPLPACAIGRIVLVILKKFLE